MSEKGRVPFERVVVDLVMSTGLRLQGCRFACSFFHTTSRGCSVTRMPLARNAMYTLLCAGFVVMAGCNQPSTPAQPPASSASAPAPAQSTASAQQAPAYTPPTADQLYQMVAPIALFPDKLVAQVLAGATYPDQITAADGVVDQNPNLKGTPLQTAIAQQPWDASVKSLTVFPTVLDQMAKNIDWTTSLGEAYVNDPTDVMNAIQVMRQRASSHGSLRSSAQLTVQTQSATASTDSYGGGSDDQPVYDGPSVVPAPSQIIEIQPTQPDTVYVPEYNPQVVYGEQVAYYPGYTYEQPRGYSGGDLLAAGAIGFGAAVLVGAIFDHHHHDDHGGGWNNWGMNWGHRGGGGNYGGGQRPAVVYNNNTYVSRSTTVVNRNVTNNNYGNRTVNNINRNVGNVGNRPGNVPAAGLANGRPNAEAGRAAGSTPHVGATPAAHAAPGMAGANRPGVSGASHAPMSMPHFNGTPQRGVTTAQSERAAGHVPNNVARPNFGGAAGVNRTQPGNPSLNRAQANVRSPEAPRMNAARPNVPTAASHAQPAFQQHAARPVTQHASQPVRAMQQPRQQAAPHVAQARPMETHQQAPQTHREQAQPRPQPAAHQGGGGHAAPAHAQKQGKEGKHEHR